MPSSATCLWTPPEPIARAAARAIDRPLAMLRAPDGEEAAAYRLLRARLRRIGDPIAVAVAGPGDRVATVAANLALAFVEARERVALVDGRGEPPPLGSLIGVPPRRLALPASSDDEFVLQLCHEFRRVVLALPADAERGPFHVLLRLDEPDGRAERPDRSLHDAASAAAAGAAESRDRPGPRPARYFGSITSSVMVVGPDTAR